MNQDILINNFFKNIGEKSNIDKQFVKDFSDTLINSDKLISFNDTNKWVGFKKKQTIKDILANAKYGFVKNVDYKIEAYKPETGRPGDDIYMTIETVKSICLMAQNEKGQQFRKYYIEMEKLFRQYISTAIQNKLTNPIPQLNKYDFDINNFMKKEVLYLIYVKDDIYKFGITADIKKRLSNHNAQLKYEYIIKCWDCLNRTVSKKIEDNIKRYCKVNKLNIIYEGQTEIIESNKIDDVIKIFDGYVSKRLDEYNQQFVNKELEQRIQLTEKVTEMINQMKELKNDKINMSINNVDDMINFINNNQNKTIKQEESIHTNKDNTIEEFEESIQLCRHCNKNKKVEEFGLNNKTNTYFKQCIHCREKCKITDKERRTKHKNDNIDADILHPQKQKHYYENHDEVREKQKEYYNDNKSEIIEQKKNYIRQRSENIDDPNKKYCKKCNTIKTNDEFGLNNKTNEQYKQCTQCRNKQTLKK